MNRWMVVIISSFLCAAINKADSPARNNDLSKAAEAAREFCEREFSGEQDQSELISLSTEYERTHAHCPENDPECCELWGITFWESDPIIVIETYRIESVTKSDRGALATVAYSRLGRITGGLGGQGRKLIVDRLPVDKVVLQLIREKERWKVLDPPPARISINRLLQLYELITQGREKSLIQIQGDPNVSDELRRMRRDKLQEARSILQSLRALTPAK